MKLNWKVRLKNSYFWITVIPAALLLVEAVANVFGYQVDTSVLNENLLQVVRTAFALLSAIGIINDPTTAGLEDSSRAMTYDEPFEV